MKFPDIISKFENAARQFPEVAALEAKDKVITYTALDSNTDRLAQLLRLRGMTRGTKVMLLLNDPVEVITAIIAVMKTGGIFIPVDPSFPVKRMETIAEEVQPELIISHERHSQSVEAVSSAVSKGVVVSLEGKIAISGDIKSSGTLQEHTDCKKIQCVRDADDPCYIYFTSGSTGKPKGIVGRWESLCHFIDWETQTFDIKEGIRVSQLTAVTFDAFLRDTFLPLCSGGTLCIPDRDTILDPPSLSKWIDDEKIHLIHCVPSLFRTFLNAPAGVKLDHLKYVLLSGEPVLPGDVQRWTTTFGDKTRLVNFYGPTETTMIKFAYFISPEDRHKRIIPIGKPIKGAAALVLDELGKPCPEGVTGEIYIRTPYRTLGYFNRPDHTREVFVQNPFTDNPRDLIYRTGDLGRITEDGNFEFAGRKDQQVKVRGIRIEPGEIESCLRDHPLVREAAVIPRKDHEENYNLSAYLVLKEKVAGEIFWEFLRRLLPGYMIPSSFVILEKMPLTASGKTDRGALALMKESRQDNATRTAPRNETEDKVLAIWKEVLAKQDIGVLDNFFEAGGHSLKATQIISRIYKVFNVKVDLKTLFREPTIEALARIISEGDKEGYEEIIPLQTMTHYEVSHSQKRFWIAEKFGEHGQGNSRPSLLLIEGPLDSELLTEAFLHSVKRHESLRTVIEEVNGEPRQKILSGDDHMFRMECIDYSLQSDIENSVNTLLAREASTPFQLDRGPLLRARLVKANHGKNYIILNMHHIINDGWSMRVLLQEVMKSYHSLEKNESIITTPLRIQYRDYAHWHNRLVSKGKDNNHRKYWLNKLTGAAGPAGLPYDLPAGNHSLYQSKTVGSVMTGEEVKALEALSLNQEATLFMTLLTCLKILIFRHSGQKDVVIGSPVAGRVTEELENQIGSFLNVLPLRDEVKAEDTFFSLLDKVKSTTLDAYSHQLYPFDRIIEDLNTRRAHGKNPLFDIGFTYHNHIESDRTIRSGDLTLTEISGTLETQHTNAATALWIMARKDREQIEMTILYNSSIFFRETIQSLASDWKKITDHITRYPDAPIGNIPLTKLSAAGDMDVSIDLAL